MTAKIVLSTLLCLACLLAAAPARAADMPAELTAAPETLADRLLDELQAKAALTAEQKTALRPIFVAQAQKRQAMAREVLAKNPGPAEMRELGRKIRETGQTDAARVAAILNPAQLKVLKDIQDARRERLRAELMRRMAGG